MLRKWFVRLFLIGLVMAVVGVGTLCTAGYLAFQEPNFYAELKTDRTSEAELLAALIFPAFSRCSG